MQFVRLYKVKRQDIPNKDTPPIERCCWLIKHLPECKQEPAKRLLDLSLDLQTISIGTRLTIEEIQSL